MTCIRVIVHSKNKFKTLNTSSKKCKQLTYKYTSTSLYYTIIKQYTYIYISTPLCYTFTQLLTATIKHIHTHKYGIIIILLIHTLKSTHTHNLSQTQISYIYASSNLVLRTIYRQITTSILWSCIPKTQSTSCLFILLITHTYNYLNYTTSIDYSPIKIQNK